jgi:hypothetical protein
MELELAPSGGFLSLPRGVAIEPLPASLAQEKHPSIAGFAQDFTLILPEDLTPPTKLC